MADDGGLRGARLGAQSWILGLLEKGFGNTQITEFLREFELSYRNQDMFRDINRLREGILSQQAVRALGPGEEVPESAMQTRLQKYPWIEPYRAEVTFAARNIETGEVTQRTVTQHFRQRPSQNDVLNEIAKQDVRWRDQSGIELVSVSNVLYLRGVSD